MITSKLFIAPIIKGLVEELNPQENNSDVLQMQYVCERMLYSYLQGQTQDQLEVLKSLKNNLDDVEYWLNIQREGIKTEILKLESQGGQG